MLAVKSTYVSRLGGCVTSLLAVASLAAGAQDTDTRLVDAAKAADATRVGALLSQGVDATTPQADGATGLHWAAHWDDAPMADALLQAGAAVDAPNDFGVTPLWLACVNGSAAMVGTLLTAGANANAALPSGETVLMTAARTGSADAVRQLVEHGANVDAPERSRGQTALMWAVAQQHPDVVKTLVELGADVHARSSPRSRRIHTRTAGFNPTGVLDVVQGGNTAMLFAARAGNLDTARHLVAGGRRRERYGARGHERAGRGDSQWPYGARRVSARAGREPERRRRGLHRPARRNPAWGTTSWRGLCSRGARTRTCRW